MAALCPPTTLLWWISASCSLCSPPPSNFAMNALDASLLSSDVRWLARLALWPATTRFMCSSRGSEVLVALGEEPLSSWVGGRGEGQDGAGVSDALGRQRDREGQDERDGRRGTNLDHLLAVRLGLGRHMRVGERGWGEERDRGRQGGGGEGWR